MTETFPNPLGLLGGTFDPVHLGHLRAAIEVAQAFLFPKVYLVPAGIPAHKRKPDLSPFKHRLEMIKLAIEGADQLGVLELEGERAGPSYTVDTLSYFNSKGLETYFIVGSEAFLEIDTWRSFGELFKLSHFIVLLREDRHRKAIPAYLKGLGLEIASQSEDELFLHSGKKILSFWPTRMDVSGSKIRSILRKGGSIKYLVPEKVLEYITENRLYLDEVH